MYKYIFLFIFAPVLWMAPVTSAQASNQVLYYQTNNAQQQLSYLYALIAQLQNQLAALQSYNPVIYPPYNNSSSNSSEISRVVTGGVESDRNDTVSLEGEVTFRRSSDARVWFEYGTNTNLSYSTASLNIDGRAGATEDFKISTSDLDNNRLYYYRAVAEDDNGRFVEGVIKSFRLNGNSSGHHHNNNNNNNDWSLEVDDDNYQTGDTIRVDYTVDDEDDRNWVGLYEVGDSNKNYVAFKYAKDEEGYLNFRINKRGDYEFRLFSGDTFDLEATSDEFEVDN